MIRINLLPYAKLQKLKTEINRQLALFGFVVVVVLIVCAGLWIHQRQQLGQLRLDIAEADKEIKRLEKVIAREGELKKLKDEITAKLATIVDLKRGQTGPAHLLDELAKSLSDQLWLTDFSEKDGKIKMTGKAFSNVSIANFLRNLEESPYFQRVELGGTSLSRAEGRSIYGFTVSCEKETPPH